MEAVTAQTRRGIQYGDLVFDIVVRTVVNKDELVVRARRATSIIEGTVFQRVVTQEQVPLLIPGLCQTVQHLAAALCRAFARTGGWSADVQIVPTPQPHVDVTMHYELEFHHVTATLGLPATNPSVDDRIDMLACNMVPRTSDAFSALPAHCHSDLQLFHDGLSVVKTVGGSDSASVVTGARYESGQHYVECRVIKRAGGDVLVGVQESGTTSGESCYPGDDAHATGRSICSDGTIIHDNTSTPSELGLFGPGDYVGVLLDMDAKTVTFTVNGRKSPTMPVVGAAYYIVVTIDSVGDAVELMPQYCWHKYPSRP